MLLNQTILTKTIVCLLEAGLPPCYWTFPAPCVCLNLNTEFENGESAYFLTHGVEFPYKRFPFGCKVLFKPSSTKSSETDGKWNAPSSVGIFAGYVMHSGYRSKGEYLVCLILVAVPIFRTLPATWVNASASRMFPLVVSCIMTLSIMSLRMLMKRSTTLMMAKGKRFCVTRSRVVSRPTLPFACGRARWR